MEIGAKHFFFFSKWKITFSNLHVARLYTPPRDSFINARFLYFAYVYRVCVYIHIIISVYTGAL